MDYEFICQMHEMYSYVRKQNRKIDLFLNYFTIIFVGEECDDCHYDIFPCNNGDSCDFIPSWEFHITKLKSENIYDNLDNFVSFMNDELDDNHSYKDLEKNMIRLNSMKIYL